MCPIPRYWDGQGRVVYDLAPHETLELGSVRFVATAFRGTRSSTPSLAHDASDDGVRFQRVYLRYEKHMADGSVVSIGPWAGLNSTSSCRTPWCRW